MKFNKLPTTEIVLSKLALGTMTFGEQTSQKDSFKIMDFAFDQGINFIDTAEMYAIPPKEETFGKTEEIIGTWLSKQKKRDEIIIATKVVGPGMDYVRGGSRLSHQQIIRAAETSLKRLKTEYIDLYQVHWPERKSNYFGRLGYEYSDEIGITIEETYKAMDKLVKDGKVRYIGISNETPWGTNEYLKLSEKYNLSKIVSIQNPYSLLNRIYEVGLAEISQHENVGLLAYSPLGFGVLTGKYLNNTPKDSRLGLYGDWFTRYSDESTVQAVRKYVDLARDHGLSPAELSLAFVNTRPFVTSNIIGATSIEQLKLAVTSIEVDMNEELENDIEEAFKVHGNVAA